MTPRRIECPRCRRLLCVVDSWGVHVEPPPHVQAHFDVGSVECVPCRKMVSFQREPTAAEAGTTLGEQG